MRSGRETLAVQEIVRRAEIAPDGVVIIHSAFRSLSRCGFHAQRFIAALVDQFARGTLLMPSMSWRTVTPEKPFFDELGTPSHTGILTELFRRQFATVRSIHPTHSVAGRGPAAESMIAGHHIDDTPCSANSPFGKLADHDAYVLLLGVGLECCTLIHYCEETVAADIYLRPPSETEVYDCRDRHGVTRSVRLRRHRRHPRDFPSFESGLATGGRLSCGSIAGTPWLVFKARDLQGQVLEALLHQAEATLAT